MKFIQFTLVFATLLLSIGCGPDTKEKSDSNIQVSDDGKTVITKADPNAPDFVPSNLPLPDACTLVTAADVAKIMNVDAGDIEIKDGSGRSSAHSRACFFKWIGERPNAGILVQVQKNPVGDEFPGWATSFVESKRSMGESDFTGSGENVKYKKLEGLGDDASYSYEMGKYIWRTGNDYVYMVAFNEEMTAPQQLKAAKDFASIIMSNVD